ncbi:MAG: DUF61 family protein [Candidatus Methanomethyliaceae archaeon]|nr:DUF61 family protein [Candidatus Methanomethyliaceae archaeon]MCX8170255.1 DUF61 family protein [Candidatus Methanomethyliaceae archaeon]MDW7970899.1 DUF61 family protein [Nitrososphaerota archaeon]
MFFSEEERLTKLLWEVELKRLNENLPKTRKPLFSLLTEEDPHYITIANEKASFDKEELKKLSSYLSEEEQKIVHLPIVIVKEFGSKKGVFTIIGNAIEIAAVNRILKREETNKFIFLPEVIELTGKLPSLIAIGYKFSELMV